MRHYLNVRSYIYIYFFSFAYQQNDKIPLTAIDLFHCSLLTIYISTANFKGCMHLHKYFDNNMTAYNCVSGKRSTVPPLSIKLYSLR